jgi:Trypsin
MKRLCRFSILALVACTQEPETDSQTLAIIGGNATAMHEAVGLVDIDGTQGRTGVLIAPNIVLTDGVKTKTVKPDAFYTGPGSSVPGNTNPSAIAGLVKHSVKSAGAHPLAIVPEPIPPGTQGFPYEYDIGYLVLDQALSITPMPYGNAVAAGASCVTVGYGFDGTTVGVGTVGLRRQAAVTVSGFFDASMGLISVAGSTGLSNFGDMGGPLLCGGNVVGISNLFHYDSANTIDQTVYQATAKADIKSWIDGIIAANPPAGPNTIDAGSSGGAASSGGTSSSGGASSGNSGNSTTTSNSGGGCSSSGRSLGGILGGLLALAFLVRRRPQGTLS